MTRFEDLPYPREVVRGRSLADKWESMVAHLDDMRDILKGAEETLQQLQEENRMLRAAVVPPRLETEKTGMAMMLKLTVTGLVNRGLFEERLSPQNARAFESVIRETIAERLAEDMVAGVSKETGRPWPDWERVPVPGPVVVIE